SIEKAGAKGTRFLHLARQSAELFKPQGLDCSEGTEDGEESTPLPSLSWMALSALAAPSLMASPVRLAALATASLASPAFSETLSPAALASSFKELVFSLAFSFCSSASFLTSSATLAASCFSSSVFCSRDLSASGAGGVAGAVDCGAATGAGGALVAALSSSLEHAAKRVIEAAAAMTAK